MNKITQLLDEKFVKELFNKEVLPLYPDFLSIKKIDIIRHKNQVWDHTYHVVYEFRTFFKTKDDKLKELPIFCSAHSDEPRKNAYDGLKFLWDNGFSKGFLTIPHALFYSDYFQGLFYRGAKGRNLYKFIREKKFSEIETIIPKAAACFAKLHNTSIKNARNFNEENSRIKTVVPGAEHTMQRIKEDYPEYYETYKKLYKIFIGAEEKFLLGTDKRWLTHGDAHPENIIKVGKKKIALIDFTDLCLSDFARDLGSFSQQVEYMCARKIADRGYAEKIKKLFLDNYFKTAKIQLDDNLQKRIDNYYNWTTIRTATFFLLKAKPEPDRARPLIKQVAEKLNIKN
jgi:thiamine kinase-like enzyme